MTKNTDNTKKTDGKNDGRRVPQTVEVRGDSLTTRETPVQVSRKAGSKPLPIAKKYEIKLLYGGGFHGPGEYRIPPMDGERELAKTMLEKTFKDSGNYTPEMIRQFSEQLYPSKKRRGRFRFEKIGSMHITKDHKLAELYRNKMIKYSHMVANEDGHLNLEIAKGSSSNNRVNKYSVTPIEVFEK